MFKRILSVMMSLMVLTACSAGNTTDSEKGDDMNSDSYVSYYDGKEEVKGYIAYPDTDEPAPALILIHEWWGLNENIENMAEAFADEGYVALAVDLYEGRVATEPEDARTYATEVRNDLDMAFNNLNAAVAYLNSLDAVKAGELAAVGWCFGGQWSYEMAKNDLGVDASVIYYGRFNPEDDLDMMTAQIIGHFGEDDESIPVDDVKAFQAKLSTLEGDHEIYIYENSSHAFANEDREDAYNKEAADEAWQRTQEFLNKVFE